MTLGGGDLDGGRAEITEALTDILGGTLEPSKAYGYARATELVLDRVAQPLADCTYETRTLRLREREPREIRVLTAAARASILWVQLTYSLPNDSFGRWNPVLVQLGCRRWRGFGRNPTCRFRGRPPSARRITVSALRCRRGIRAGRVVPSGPVKGTH
jgi:hypothetical protein